MKILSHIPTWCIWISFALFAAGSILGIIYHTVKLFLIFRSTDVGYGIGYGLGNLIAVIVIIAIPALCMLDVIFRRKKQK